MLAWIFDVSCVVAEQSAFASAHMFYSSGELILICLQCLFNMEPWHIVPEVRFVAKMKTRETAFIGEVPHGDLNHHCRGNPTMKEGRVRPPPDPKYVSPKQGTFNFFQNCIPISLG